MKAKKILPIKLPRINLKANGRSYLFIFLTIFVVVFLAYHFKVANRILGKFLAGTVNGQPIFKSQLTNRLYTRYGNQILESLIVDTLVRQEAKSKGVVVSQQELEEAIGKIKEQLGQNSDLESILAFQGIERSEFEDGVRVEVMARKLLEKDISITDEEIGQFIKENKKTMAATSEAGLKEEARRVLSDQKLGERINTWIGELEKKAKIERYLR